MEKITDDLPPFSFLNNLNSKEIKELNAIAHKHKNSKNSFVFQANQINDTIYILISGRAKIYRQAQDGKELIQWFCMPGEIFGLSQDIQSSCRGLNAQALTTCEVLSIRRQVFNQYLLENPRLALLIINQLSQRIRTLGDMLLNLASEDVMSRLTKILTRLCYQHGKLEGDNLILDIPLTQQEIADMIGASRQTVNSSLSKLRKQGYLKIENHCIHIQDSNTLKEYLKQTVYQKSAVV